MTAGGLSFRRTCGIFPCCSDDRELMEVALAAFSAASASARSCIHAPFDYLLYWRSSWLVDKLVPVIASGEWYRA